MVLKPLLFGVMLPAVISGVVLLIGNRAGEGSGRRWASSLAIGLACIGGYWGVIGLPPFLPIEASQWLFYLVGVAIVVGGLNGSSRVPAWVRWTLNLLLVALTSWLLVRPLLQYSWQGVGGILRLVGVIGGFLAFWFFLHRLLLSASAAVWNTATLCIIATTTSVVLVLSGSALLGQLGGVLTASVGAVVVLAWRLPAISLARSGTAVIAIWLGGLLLAGYLYAAVPITSLILLILSPAAAWVGHLPYFKSARPWQRALVQLAAVSAPAILAVVLAIDISAGGDYGY